jgi:hypothetical protein
MVLATSMHAPANNAIFLILEISVAEEYGECGSIANDAALMDLAQLSIRSQIRSLFAPRSQ